MFLDPNMHSKDGTAALGSKGGVKWSEDGSYVAYEVKKSGSDWATIYVRDTKTKKDLNDELNWVKFSVISWTPDNKGFFYGRYKEPKSIMSQKDKAGEETDSSKNHMIFYHRVGTSQDKDILIHEDPSNPL